MINLPQPAFTGKMPLEEVLHARRTVRSFASTPLCLSQLSQLLWATYGMTDHRGGKKTVPSAGALYPLDCYLAAGDDDAVTTVFEIPTGHEPLLIVLLGSPR